MALGLHGGLAPAAFAFVFISSLGDRTTAWKQALALASFIAILGSILFSGFLRVQIPIWFWGF